MRAPAPFHMALPMCTYLQMRLTMVAHCTHTAGKYDKKVTRAKTANVVRPNDQRVVVSLCPASILRVSQSEQAWYVLTESYPNVVCYC